MQFTDLRLPLGTRMQLNITCHDYKPMALPAQLLGYRSGFKLLVHLQTGDRSQLRFSNLINRGLLLLLSSSY
jgi:hypothetical protein